MPGFRGSLYMGWSAAHGIVSPSISQQTIINAGPGAGPEWATVEARR